VDVSEIQKKKEVPLMRTRLVAAKQRLAFAGLLSTRLAEGAAAKAHLDLLERVAAALPPCGGYECVFSGLVDQEHGVFDRCGALYHIATQGGTARWHNPAPRATRGAEGEWERDQLLSHNSSGSDIDEECQPCSHTNLACSSTQYTSATILSKDIKRVLMESWEAARTPFAHRSSRFSSFFFGFFSSFSAFYFALRNGSGTLQKRPDKR
jgi:hypothetical protein